jgi:hypothetical protein
MNANDAIREPPSSFSCPDVGGTIETCAVPLEYPTMMFRLYWLGPATEPGTWGLDTGIGTPIWRINGGWELEGLVSSKEIDPSAPADHPRPRGWIEVWEENGICFSAPQGTFKRSGIRQDSDDPIVQGYLKHGRPAF